MIRDPSGPSRDDPLLSLALVFLAILADLAVPILF
jgi:hypothetical protein